MEFRQFGQSWTKTGGRVRRKVANTVKEYQKEFSLDMPYTKPSCFSLREGKHLSCCPPPPPLLDNPQKQICADMKADIPHSSLIIYSSCLHPPPPITHPTLTVPAAAGLTVTPISNGKVTAVFPSKSKLMIIVSNRNCAWNIYKNLFTLIKDS